MSILGIDLGGTKTAISRLTPHGSIEEVARFPTAGWRDTRDRIFAEIAGQAPAASGPLVIGISCGGPLDERHGLILSPPNLPGWDRVPICTELERRFGGRACLMNDANACALAEWWFGAGRGCAHLVFLTCGTGMGAGLILNNQLYAGATGDAGEVGHLRLADDGPSGYGKTGSFEGFCSGGGIARLAQLRLRDPVPFPGSILREPGEMTAKRVAEAAQAGDAFALGVMQEAGRRLGQALALIVDVINPEKIVIGGFYASCRSLLEPALLPVLDAEALPRGRARCAIVPAQLGSTIGSHGAVAAALYASGQTPPKAPGPESRLAANDEPPGGKRPPP